MDFNNIDYEEIYKQREKEKDPYAFLDKYTCSLDKESGKMVGKDMGDFVITEAAMVAIFLAKMELHKKYNKRVLDLQILSIFTCVVNLIFIICHIFR
jgi:hypothetical protein